jgi:hypothetical protein
MSNQNIIPLIRDADRGRLVGDMQDAVDKIVKAIEDNRGAGTGKLTLTLTIKSKSEGTYTITPALTTKIPEAPRADMITFLDEPSGELIRRDPRQPDLPGVTTADFRRADQE